MVILLSITAALILVELIVAYLAAKNMKSLRLFFLNSDLIPSKQPPKLQTYINNLFPLAGVWNYRSVQNEFSPWVHTFFFLFELAVMWYISGIVIYTYGLSSFSIALAIFGGILLSSMNIALLVLFWPVYFRPFMRQQELPNVSFETVFLIMFLCLVFVSVLGLRFLQDQDFILALQYLLSGLICDLVLRFILIILIRTCGLDNCLRLPKLAHVSRKDIQLFLDTFKCKYDPLNPYQDPDIDVDDRRKIMVFSDRKNSVVPRISRTYMEDDSDVSFLGYSDSFTKAFGHSAEAEVPDLPTNCVFPALQESSVMTESAANVFHKSKVFSDSGLVVPKRNFSDISMALQRLSRFSQLHPVLEEQADPSCKIFKLKPLVSAPQSETVTIEDRPQSEQLNTKAKKKKKLRINKHKKIDSIQSERAKLDDFSPEPIDGLPHIESPPSAEPLAFNFKSIYFMDDEIWDEEFKEQPLTPSPVETLTFSFDKPPFYTKTTTEEDFEPLPQFHIAKKTRKRSLLPQTPKTVLNYESPYLEPLPRLSKKMSSLQRSTSASRMGTKSRSIRRNQSSNSIRLNSNN